jgi:hypothetical protein
MQPTILPAFIVAGGIVVGATVLGLLWGGRYSSTATPPGVVYVVDRFTGITQFCNPHECKRVKEREPDPLADLIGSASTQQAPR